MGGKPGERSNTCAEYLDSRTPRSWDLRVAWAGVGWVGGGTQARDCRVSRRDAPPVRRAGGVSIGMVMMMTRMMMKKLMLVECSLCSHDLM